MPHLKQNRSRSRSKKKKKRPRGALEGPEPPLLLLVPPLSGGSGGRGGGGGGRNARGRCAGTSGKREDGGGRGCLFNFQGLILNGWSRRAKEGYKQVECNRMYR